MSASNVGGLESRPAHARAHAPGTETAAETSAFWSIESHICRKCHSRLVSHAALGGRLFECTNCGERATGAEPAVLCCCGMKIRRPNRSGASGHMLVDAGIRCVRNEAPTPEFPSVIVAVESTL